MDRLLRAAILRRELEAEAVSVEGDYAAKLHCVSCGRKRCTSGEDDIVSLFCPSCGSRGRNRGKTPEEKAAWELFTEARRAQLQRAAADVEAMMAGAKQCSKCGKQLRIDNKRGICGDLMACRARAAKDKDHVEPIVNTVVLPEQPPEWDDLMPEAENIPAPPSLEKPLNPPRNIPDKIPGGTPLERFRRAVEAMGLDHDQVLEGLADKWLDRVRAAVQG